jgi:hypothetical protein
MLPIPILLAAALTAGSVGANYMGARQADRARADVLRAERIRQKGYDKEAMALNAAAQDRYADVEKKQGEKASDLEAMYLEGADEVASPNLPATNSAITISESEKKSGEARAETDDRAKRRADLVSFGDLFGDIGRATGRDAGNLAMIRGFQQGSQAPLAAELDAATYAGQGWRTAGDVMAAGAAIATPFALSGAGTPAWLTNLMGQGGATAAARAPGMPMPRPEGLVSLYG